MKPIKINEHSSVSKHEQIIAQIEKNIKSGGLKEGDKLPSINSIRDNNSLSRDTVLLAYKKLKLRGIVNSVYGKGYYIKNANINVTKRIFILFDELNSFKEDLYNSLVQNIKHQFTIEVYFHYFDINIFNKLVLESIDKYSAYVIMPANLEGTEEAIRKLPRNNVFILDQMPKGLKNYNAIFQNAEKDIFNRLLDCFTQVKRYQNITLLFDKKQPLGIKNGFLKFCKIAGMQYEIIENQFDKIEPQKGDIYIIPDDKSLVLIIKKIKKERLRIGADVGIIAINDTLLKEILEDGITTITTNFIKMGRELARMLTSESNKSLQIENPIDLILRKSL